MAGTFHGRGLVTDQQVSKGKDVTKAQRQKHRGTLEEMQALKRADFTGIKIQALAVFSLVNELQGGN